MALMQVLHYRLELIDHHHQLYSPLEKGTKTLSFTCRALPSGGIETKIVKYWRSRRDNQSRQILF